MREHGQPRAFGHPEELDIRQVQVAVLEVQSEPVDRRPDRRRA
jgi:hypothetical protein